MRLTLLHIVIIKTIAVFGGASGVLPFGWACILFFGADFWVLYHLLVPNASGLVRVFNKFETSAKEVWLTIDDGPDPQDTPRLLKLLAEHDARATFFLIGERAAKHPELVADIARGGHEIGNHTQRHRASTFWCSPAAFVARELDSANATIVRATRAVVSQQDRTEPVPPPKLKSAAGKGAAPNRFRAPVGIKNLFLASALAQRGMACIGWSIRSHDTFARDPAAVVSRVMRQVKPGAIILMHEGFPLHEKVRIHAIAGVLTDLHARGFRCVIPTEQQLR